MPLLCAILGFNAAWLQCPDWGRVGWSSKWFHTSMRGLPDLSHALLLDMDGRNPNSFVIPAIAKPGMRVVRLTGDLESIGQKDKYNEVMMQVVRSHSGPVFLLTSMGDAKEEIASAATLGFQEDKSPGEYAPVPNNADHSIVLIRLKR